MICNAKWQRAPQPWSQDHWINGGGCVAHLKLVQRGVTLSYKGSSGSQGWHPHPLGLNQQRTATHPLRPLVHLQTISWTARLGCPTKTSNSGCPASSLREIGRKATPFYPFSLQCTCACKSKHTDTHRRVSGVWRGRVCLKLTRRKVAASDARGDTAQKKGGPLSVARLYIFFFLWMRVQSAETGVKQRSAAFSDSLIYRTSANALIQGGEVSERDSAERLAQRGYRMGAGFPK